MKIILNGKEIDVEVGLTISELLVQKKLNPKAIIIEYNGELVKEDAWSETILKENDKLEILQFVGGG